MFNWRPTYLCQFPGSLVAAEERPFWTRKKKQGQKLSTSVTFSQLRVQISSREIYWIYMYILYIGLPKMIIFQNCIYTVLIHVNLQLFCMFPRPVIWHLTLLNFSFCFSQKSWCQVFNSCCCSLKYFSWKIKLNNFVNLFFIKKCICILYRHMSNVLTWVFRSDSINLSNNLESLVKFNTSSLEQFLLGGRK